MIQIKITLEYPILKMQGIKIQVKSDKAEDAYQRAISLAKEKNLLA